MKLPIYMDNHSTTALDPRVLEAMLPYFTEVYGNAASRNHRFGWEAEAAVETARKQIAKLINCGAKDTIFTSGATESDNLAIKGVAWAYRGKGNHIVTLPTEHKAVLDCLKRLEQDGFRVTYLPVGRDGLLDPGDLRKALTDHTILVTIMAANNEIGVLQPIAEIGPICRARGVLFHTDAVQAVGKVAIDVEAMSIDLLSLSGHKIYGPKGVGALYVRGQDPAVTLVPLIDGGGHERGMRSGTLNVPSIVGLGKACEISMAEMGEESRRLAALRDRLEEGMLGLDDVHVNGSMEHRLPHNLNLSFGGVEGESLLVGMSDVALSLGSACMSATREPSYVLKALGVSDDLAQSGVRFGLGRFNTEEEVEYVIGRVVETVKNLRDVAGPPEKTANRQVKA